MKQDKQLVAFAMKKEEIAKLKKEAEEMDLSLSAYIRFIIARRKK